MYFKFYKEFNFLWLRETAITISYNIDGDWKDWVPQTYSQGIKTLYSVSGNFEEVLLTLQTNEPHFASWEF